MLNLVKTDNKSYSFESLAEMFLFMIREENTNEITEIHATDGSIKDNQLNSLQRVMDYQYKSLKILDLSGNELGSMHYDLKNSKNSTADQVLSNIFKEMHKLERIDLSNNELGKNIKKMSESAGDHNKLKAIDLSHNNLKDDGGEHASKILKAKNLEIFKINSNHIEKSGMKDILNIAKKSTSLAKIDVSGNDCDHVSSHISSLLKRSVQLEEFHANDCDLDSKDLSKITKGIGKNDESSLKILSIENTRIKDHVMEDFQELLSIKQDLRIITKDGEITHDESGENALEKIAEAILHELGDNVMVEISLEDRIVEETVSETPDHSNDSLDLLADSVIAPHDLA